MSKHLSLIIAVGPADFAAEVILSLLIESFDFTPSEKEIYWEMGGIVTPMVVGGETHQLPVVVKLVQPIV